jgi:branched-chain amino acid transport system permease protein
MKKGSFKWSNHISYTVVAIFTIIFSIISLTGGLPSSTLYLLEKISIAIILAVSLSLVVGFLGELSLGHAGFMCVGAYIGGKVSVMLSGAGMGTMTNPNIVNLLISLLVGGACAALCGVIIGLPALRLKGDYLAIVTLAFGEIVKSIFQNTSHETFGGALGLKTPRFDKDTLFIFSFILVVLALFVIQNIIHSKHGRAITSIRDNEIAARATGINVTKYKLVGFTVSAFFAGIAGVLYSFSNYTVQSAKFGYNYSIEILVMVVLGGMGSINGSIVAATLITFLNTKLATVLTGGLAVLQNLLYALILIIIVLYNNAPALASFRERYNFSNFIKRIYKPKHDPAKVRDDKASWDKIPTKIKMDAILSLDLSGKETLQREDDKGDE